MKKRSMMALLLTTALTFGNVVPAAAAPYCGGGGRCGQNYVDANGDGICDNFVDADGDGINDNCPGYGNGQGQYPNETSAATPEVKETVKKAVVKKTTVKKTAVKKTTVKKTVAKKAAVKKATIKKVQKRLNKIGYKCGTANGSMNKKTKSALKKFKKANGLKANSNIDKSTLKALRLSK